MDCVTLTERFLGAIFNGNMGEALEMVSAEARFIGTRPTACAHNPLFGTHIGAQGMEHFFKTFMAVLEPGEFIVTAKFGTAENACFFGTLRHTVRSTGKPFASDWALVTEVRDGRLTLYHFYEDTAALEEAMRAG